MSFETTMARAAFRAAETTWKGHVLQCPRCTRAVRARHWDELCSAGAADRREMRETRAALDRERALDKAPMPGQEALF